MLVFLLGLVVFLGVHSVRIVAPDWRTKMIDNKSERTWKGIYSLVSLVGLGLLMYGYGLARPDANILFVSPAWARTVAFAAMPISLIVLMASNFPAGYIKRFLRHPMLVAVLLWSSTHLLANGDSVSALLFAAFLIWAVVDLWSAANRPAQMADKTLVWPDLLALALGIALTWLLIVWAHEWMMGVGLH